MKSRSSLVESQEIEFAVVVPCSRRRPHRQKIRTLTHVNLDAANGAILRDLNEFGIAMQTVTPLAPNQQIHLRFELPAPRVRVSAVGRIVWTDSWGQAGVQFLNLPLRSERLLKEWILTQILSSAYLFSPCESVAVEGNHAEGATELLFSASPRPAIQLEPHPGSPPSSPHPKARPRSLRLLWCPVPISPSVLSKLVDALLLLCAVLLFAVMSLALTGILPTWPITMALAIGVAGIFLTVYWFLFVFWIGATPGEHLARMACSESANGMQGGQDDQARFR
jgi:hypothetical protein